MPAIPLFIQILLTALFTPTILARFGINLNGTDVQNGVTAAPVVVQAPPSTPGAVVAPPVQPTTKQIASDAVKNPVSLFGIAAVGFTSVFVIAQLRAAGHEATETSKDLYRAGEKVTGSLGNADASTRNISRRASN
ncbi:hypothetical protein E7T09_04525 [Deinococcus sp. KSM4-11]|uniref:hypothetical protein n=1 Tax=Deinococcus sp. KSM4-11 TaxID=2568654 RepID=UPI0010A56D0F|nr:hypothetical protein [Deinococcus sp. KSM4-11]THF88476.1 hypothetical protein E7T09_04525 [Deinococcus sp. KSM4-11]